MPNEKHAGGRPKGSGNKRGKPPAGPRIPVEKRPPKKPLKKKPEDEGGGRA